MLVVTAAWNLMVDIRKYRWMYRDAAVNGRYGSWKSFFVNVTIKCGFSGLTQLSFNVWFTTSRPSWTFRSSKLLTRTGGWKKHAVQGRYPQDAVQQECSDFARKITIFEYFWSIHCISGHIKILTREPWWIHGNPIATSVGIRCLPYTKIKTGRICAHTDVWIMMNPYHDDGSVALHTMMNPYHTMSTMMLTSPYHDESKHSDWWTTLRTFRRCRIMIAWDILLGHPFLPVGWRLGG